MLDNDIKKPSEMEEKDTLVEVRDLKKHFKVSGKGMLHAVDGVNLP